MDNTVKGVENPVPMGMFDFLLDNVDAFPARMVGDMPIQIRIGTPEDAGGILECLILTLAERTWFDRDENEAGINNSMVLKQKIKAFRPGERAYLVAVEDDRVVGFILLVRGVLKSVKHTADFGMSILPGYREKGIGSGLVQAAIDWAKHYGVEKLYCCTFSTNPRAIALYQKFGFAEEGLRSKQYKIEGEYVDQILFGKILD